MDPSLPLLDLVKQVDSALMEFLKMCQDRALKNWKQCVACWNLSSADLHLYIKNPEPSKAVVIKNEAGDLVASPPSVFEALNSFWGGIERWPSESLQEWANFIAEDRCSPLLPHKPFCFRLSVSDVIAQVKKL